MEALSCGESSSLAASFLECRAQPGGPRAQETTGDYETLQRKKTVWRVPQTRPRSALGHSDPTPLRIMCTLGVLRTLYFECSAPFGACGKASVFGPQRLRYLRLKAFCARFACSQAPDRRRRPLRHRLSPSPRANLLFFVEVSRRSTSHRHGTVI